jgi:hypothetical protein
MMRTNTRFDRYRIQNNGDHFYCGKLKNGNQALMGVQRPRLTMVEFDANGKFVQVSFREATSAEGNVKAEAEDQLNIELLIWQKEVGFKPRTISVKPFFLSDLWIGIKDLPDHYQEVLDNPEKFDEQRRQVLEEDIHNWYDDGNFVFYWDEEYYLDEEGELESS